MRDVAKVTASLRLESTNLMGYGWPELGDPVLSDCDIDGLAFVPPGEGRTPARSTDSIQQA